MPTSVSVIEPADLQGFQLVEATDAVRDAVVHQAGQAGQG